jgi:hypothetical protein
MKKQSFKDAFKYLMETINGNNEDRPARIEDQELADQLQMSYARGIDWLRREYPGAENYDTSSLDYAIKPWGIVGWPDYAERARSSIGTCRRYAVNKKDYEIFAGKLVAVPSSVDQFGREVRAGLRTSRWTDPT